MITELSITRSRLIGLDFHIACFTASETLLCVLCLACFALSDVLC